MSKVRKTDWLEMMKLVVITSGDRDAYVDTARSALDAGCRCIQFRDKSLDDRAFMGIAKRIKECCDAEGALLFINDRVDVAFLVGSSGVHLGVDDIDVEEARKALAPEAIIGYSPEGLEDAGRAVKRGADYLGIGPVYRSPTKSDAGEPIGIDGLEEYCRKNFAPVIAVGGIDETGIDGILSAGASGLAVSSAVYGSENPRERALSILGRIEEYSR